MSSVTIKDMVKIVEHYGYVPIPIDLDENTLSCDLEVLERSITQVYDLTSALLFSVMQSFKDNMLCRKLE